MSLSTSLMLIAVFVQITFPLLKRNNYMKGRFLTQPLVKRWPNVFVKRSGFWDGRIKQIMIIFVLCFPISILLASVQNLWSFIYFGSIIALYIDDWFADDDNFKKLWDTVRNKIKWKMELPQPAKAGSKVG